MWEVETTDVFDKWFDVQTEALKEDMLAAMMILSEYGPQLGRPFADTVIASAFSNMKELRVQHQGNPIPGGSSCLILLAMASCYALAIKQG